MKWLRFFFVLNLFLGFNYQIKAQFLFTESFLLIPLDTNKHYVGRVAGSFSSQTQKEVVNQFAARAELVTRLKNNNILTFANNFQVLTNGGQTVLSGGYLFARFRKNIIRSLYPEYYAQFQWLESRGLESKFALTANLRQRIYRDDIMTLATAAGVLLEYEKWNFDGVKTQDLPINTNPITTYSPRFNWYLSYENRITENIHINTAIYYFLRLSFAESLPRLGMHCRLDFKINSHLTYNLNLKTMYEYQPIVPVNNLWYNINNELVYTF
jgi:hypothetical protein